jgi:hypothetical protein
MDRPAWGFLVLSCLTACQGEPTYVPRPLPPLVVPARPAELQPISVAASGFAVGERFVYAVRVRGFSIGTAEVTAGTTEIHSTFATSMLAGAFSSVHDDLVTTLDGARPATSVEHIELDGKKRTVNTTYTGTDSHSLHTAFGLVRAWAAIGAAPGYIHVTVPDHVLRVELGEPSGGKDWLRVDGKIVGLDDPARFTVWLDRRRTITRVEVRSAGDTVTADLVQ